MKRAWFDNHKIGCLNFPCEFHTVGKVKKSVAANTHLILITYKNSNL